MCLCLLLLGCDAGYYGHLVRGQARLIMDAQPLDAVLARAALDSTRSRRLRLTRDICAFGGQRLGLRVARSFSLYYDTHGEPVSWNVSACAPDRFSPYLWHFPIAGTVPYKGYFERSRAEREAQRLRQLGLDVVVRPVAGYSTLGYLPDPVLSTMLDYTPDVLADLILHELTHGTVYVPGCTDFNESLATFVGTRGSLQFLAEHYGEDSRWILRARQRRGDQARFQHFMTSVVASLDSLYKHAPDSVTARSQRVLVFASAKRRYRALRDSFKLLDYDGFLDWQVNNARLLSFRRYHTDLSLFDSLRQANDGSLSAVIALAKDCGSAARPWSCMRAPTRSAP